MKLNLYIDFDGVILNTIEVSYKKIKEQYGKNANAYQSAQYYQSIDWNHFLEECSPINNGIENIKKLIASELFEVSVLTHVLSQHEEEVKEEYLKKYIPNLNFIAVKKPTPKWAAVDCKGAILVDDYSENLIEWEKHGGISIKFSQKEKKYDFKSIKSLDELIDLYDILTSKKNKSTKIKTKGI